MAVSDGGEARQQDEAAHAEKERLDRLRGEDGRQRAEEAEAEHEADDHREDELHQKDGEHLAAEPRWMPREVPHGGRVGGALVVLWTLADRFNRLNRAGGKGVGA